ncbi:TonB-dependent receptor [Helicobacter sp. MIT 21-1697]|uniref:TonB-dependent receptor n=1 Tax=Helicobacter sp. MIT 21-1697 TaxID=2993733 RepID=UPI00224AE66A|nr:TonB-dependent receptor [Helicobacter sp. MIT 21-1697]MCX2717089.1 TonB-dependent receptor [Helicobacter sp. MIT 21-1697]
MIYKIFISVSIFCVIVYANETRSINLGQSIVIASRIDTPINEAPGNISVINQKQINQRPNYKFSDTLRGFEGLQQSKSRGMDTFDGVKIRGLSGAAIMVDGIILNDINNNTKMLTAMNADDIAQVEVVRGAFSNIYGSGAVAGAINFITAMPISFETKANFGYGSALGTEFAPKNTFRAYISVGDALFEKKLRFKASFGTTTTQGYAADSVIVQDVSGYAGAKPTLNSNTGALVWNIGDMGRQAYNTYDTNVKAEYDIGDVGTLNGYLRYNMYSYDHKNQQSFITQNGIPSYGSNADINSNKPAPILYGRHIGKEMYNQLISALGYKHYLPSESYLEVKFYRIDGWDRFNNPDGGANPSSANTTIYGGVGSQTNHKYETNNFDVIYVLPFSENHRILAGVQYRHNDYTQKVHYIDNWKNFNTLNIGRGTSGYAQGGKTDSVGIFAEWSAQWQQLSSNVGLRYDYWRGFDIYKDADIYASNIKHQVSPKISLNYAFSSLTRTKISFGQAFKAPNFGQMFSNRTYTDGTLIRGNPNLKPENVLSFDIGLEQDIPTLFGEGEYGNLKVYYFNNTITNAIMQYSISYADTTLRGSFDNLGKNRIQGLETSLLLPIGYGFGVHLTYTFMHSEILKSLESTTIGNKVAGIPAHLAYGAITYDNASFYGSFGVEYASKPYKNATNVITPSGVYGATDSYTLADMRLGWRIDKHFDISGNITNLFNHTYYSYYRASGRSFFVALNGKF